ncbi:hypothetical protein, unlikely [Trypanosoma brucei gambiense DAL972]|uniref:Uncharacterized protein n=1 Tax=Trypanosoma brucei gambiense (strain MHOM/CI/86/DAL972) TaxID=679716 RepID=C9ZUF4_TRYB9|nr:hypothetical protein, unlikely [Trypanosoma brucei gambiense DAL972]CBH13041.1 hypothetical protein, unlikely [Trypanosoma brucei gambiense DAL972]|eukprot:XP_011775319.1 hypothetical protein, unlikely [Trypanosoma brucei gambiense DAL972]
MRPDGSYHKVLPRFPIGGTFHEHRPRFPSGCCHLDERGRWDCGLLIDEEVGFIQCHRPRKKSNVCLKLTTPLGGVREGVTGCCVTSRHRWGVPCISDPTIGMLLSRTAHNLQAYSSCIYIYTLCVLLLPFLLHKHMSCSSCLALQGREGN